MSWLSGIAGKAEAILNQIDQATAQSLGEAGISPQKPSSSTHQPPIERESGLSYEPVAQPPSSSFVQQPTANFPRKAASAQHAEKKSTDPLLSTWDSSLSWLPPSGTSPSSRVARKNRSEQEEDSLLEFLNSPPRGSLQAGTSRPTHTHRLVVQKEPGRGPPSPKSRKPQSPLSASDAESQGSHSRQGKEPAATGEHAAL